VRCMSMVLRYIIGIFCLGCDPGWANYIHEDPITHHIVLNLTPETCNQIRDGCLPVFELVHELLVELARALVELTNALGGTNLTYNPVDICDGDCGNWLCHVFFAGNQADTNAIADPDAKKRRSVDESFSVAMSQIENGVQKIF